MSNLFTLTYFRLRNQFRSLLSRHHLVPMAWSCMLILATLACGEELPGPKPVSKQGAIRSFGFSKAQNPTLPSDYKAVVTDSTIRLVLPDSINLENLVPSISHSPFAQLSPDGNRDFRDAITYVVRNGNAKEKSYKVSIVNDIRLERFAFLNTENKLVSSLNAEIQDSVVRVIFPEGVPTKGLRPNLRFSKDVKFELPQIADYDTSFMFSLRIANWYEKHYYYQGAIVPELEAFFLVSPNGTDTLRATITGSHVQVVAPESANLQNLKAVLKLSQSLSFEPQNQRDFSQLVEYTLRNSHGAERRYQVSVRKQFAPGILSFGVLSPLNSYDTLYAEQLSQHRFSLSVPTYIDRSKLRTVVKVPADCRIEPASQTDFSRPVWYTVTNKQGKTQRVQVEVVPSVYPQILSFSLVSEQNRQDTVHTFIKGQDISATIPFRYNINELLPVLKVTSGARYEPLTQTDFSDTVVYRLRNSMGQTATYKVKLSQPSVPQPELQRFGLVSPLYVSDTLWGAVQAGRVQVVVPNNYDVRNLVPVVKTAEGISFSPSSNFDFSKTLAYSLRNVKGVEKNYQVEVQKAGVPKLLSFRVPYEDLTTEGDDTLEVAVTGERLFGVFPNFVALAHRRALVKVPMGCSYEFETPEDYRNEMVLRVKSDLGQQSVRYSIKLKNKPIVLGATVKEDPANGLNKAVRCEVGKKLIYAHVPKNVDLAQVEVALQYTPNVTGRFVGDGNFRNVRTLKLEDADGLTELYKVEILHVPAVNYFTLPTEATGLAKPITASLQGNTMRVVIPKKLSMNQFRPRYGVTKGARLYQTEPYRMGEQRITVRTKYGVQTQYTLHVEYEPEVLRVVDISPEVLDYEITPDTLYVEVPYSFNKELNLSVAVSPGASVEYGRSPSAPLRDKYGLKLTSYGGYKKTVPVKIRKNRRLHYLSYDVLGKFGRANRNNGRYHMMLSTSDNLAAVPIHFLLEGNQQAQHMTVDLSARQPIQVELKHPYDGFVKTVELVPHVYKPFVTVWNAADTKLELPLSPSGTYDFMVDWGDGTTSRVYNYQATPSVMPGAVNTRFHTYRASGSYRVSIIGTMRGFSFDGYSNNLRNKLIEVKQWGDFQMPEDANGMFSFCSNMNVTALDVPNMRGVKSLRKMFYGASKLRAGVRNWDVSQVENMDSLFQEAYEFNDDLSAWQVQKLKTADAMFARTRKFNSDISEWETHSLQSMSRMFGSSVFNQPIGDWDVSKVTDMSRLFEYNSVFNQTLSLWETGRVTNMCKMFIGANVFDGNISDWDVSKVQDMSHMFNSASKFSGDISSWTPTSLTKMGHMFHRAGKQRNDLSGWCLKNLIDKNPNLGTHNFQPAYLPRFDCKD